MKVDLHVPCQVSHWAFFFFIFSIITFPSNNTQVLSKFFQKIGDQALHLEAVDDLTFSE